MTPWKTRDLVYQTPSGRFVARDEAFRPDGTSNGSVPIGVVANEPLREGFTEVAVDTGHQARLGGPIMQMAVGRPLLSTVDARNAEGKRRRMESATDRGWRNTQAQNLRPLDVLDDPLLVIGFKATVLSVTPRPEDRVEVYVSLEESEEYRKLIVEKTRLVRRTVAVEDPPAIDDVGLMENLMDFEYSYEDPIR